MTQCKTEGIETVLKSRIPQAIKAWYNGNEEPLKELHIATTEPVFKQSGWTIPYYECMNKYCVKTKHNGVIEMYALNKMDIRRKLKSDVVEIAKV